MKTILVLLISFLVCTVSFAQCDNAYFPFEDGVTFELTSFKSNGKETGKVKNEIVNGDQEDQVTVKNEIYDKKGKLLNEGEYTVICKNGSIQIDMRGFIPEQTMSQMENMEMTLDGDFLEIPNDLEAGQELPDGTGTITMKMSQGGVDMNTNMNFTYTDRKVEKEETITTPAGTFDTYKITQTTNIDSEIMGMMSQSSSMRSASWIAEGVGTVKSENYDKKGKVESYTLLTDFGK